MDKVTGQCPQTTTFFEEKGEPKRYRTEVLPLTSLTPYRWAQPVHRALDGFPLLLLLRHAVVGGDSGLCCCAPWFRVTSIEHVWLVGSFVKHV